jgi:tetratricopeptide (TPR) repeat protein
MRLIAVLLVLPVLLLAQSVESGKAELKDGNLAKAKAIFEQVLAVDDGNAEAHYQLGLVLLQREFRNEDEAVDQMEQAVDLVPDNADYQYGYGAALGIKTQHAGVLKQAFLAPKVKKAFLRAVELNPKHVQARIGLAQYFLQAPSIMGGDSERGWKEIDTVIRLDEFRGRIVRSRMLEREKKITEAEVELRTLADRLPENWRVWDVLSSFYLRNSQNDRAITAAQRFVQMRPDTAESYKTLGQAQFQKGDYDAALGSLTKALSLDKDFLSAIYLMGRTYAAKGMKREARESYRRVLDLNPGDRLRKEVEKNLNDLS